MKKHLTIKQTNRILSLIIVFLVLLIAVYFVKGRVQAAQMKTNWPTHNSAWPVNRPKMTK